jgi:hypothetical protein
VTIVFILLVGAVVLHGLHREGLITAVRGPNNNLGCIPLLAVFILTIWLITKIPV